MTRPTGFATVDRPEAWPRLRGAPRPERLEAPLDSLPGVGPRLAGRLRKLGLGTVGDLLEHRPRDYQRSVGESRIVDLFGEQEAVIVGEVRSVSLRRARGRLTILTATVADESGSIPAVWFNQDWLEDKLLPGTRVRLRGQLRRNDVRRQLVRPERRRPRPPTSRRSIRPARRSRRRGCARSPTARSSSSRTSPTRCRPG